MRLFAIVVLLMAVLVANCYPVERTEVQRYYDLGVSYIKSDLYEDGLKTLNQVAFLYPDSDVADDALYQLALIRERVGDGEITIGDALSSDILDNFVNPDMRKTGFWINLAGIHRWSRLTLHYLRILTWAREGIVYLLWIRHPKCKSMWYKSVKSDCRIYSHIRIHKSV